VPSGEAAVLNSTSKWIDLRRSRVDALPQRFRNSVTMAGSCRKNRSTRRDDRQPPISRASAPVSATTGPTET
jgi:hypothetical protein